LPFHLQFLLLFPPLLASFFVVFLPHSPIHDFARRFCSHSILPPFPSLPPSLPSLPPSGPTPPSAPFSLTCTLILPLSPPPSYKRRDGRRRYKQEL
jgi:hypothetical protein